MTSEREKSHLFVSMDICSGNPFFSVSRLVHSRPRQNEKIAFARGGTDVWIANLDGTAAKKICHGVYPDISPDGARVAFNTQES
jgi:hypothetical protein